MSAILNGLGHQLFAWLGPLSIELAALALLVLAAGRLIRSPALRHLLWLAVLVKPLIAETGLGSPVLPSRPVDLRPHAAARVRTGLRRSRRLRHRPPGSVCARPHPGRRRGGPLEPSRQENPRHDRLVCNRVEPGAQNPKDPRRQYAPDGYEGTRGRGSPSVSSGLRDHALLRGGRRARIGQPCA